MAVLGYLPKLKGALGLAFGAHSLHDFFHKNVFFYLLLYQQAKFQCHTSFPSQDNKQNVLLSFYLVDDGTNYKIYVGSRFKAMADMEKKRGRRKYKNLNISRTKRAF